MRRTGPTVKLQIRIPPELKREAETAAEAAGQLMSVFVTRAITAHVLKAKAALRSDEAGERL
jgi:predicted HicB family RNase H-like nuclease